VYLSRVELLTTDILVSYYIGRMETARKWYCPFSFWSWPGHSFWKKKNKNPQTTCYWVFHYLDFRKEHTSNIERNNISPF